MEYFTEVRYCAGARPGLSIRGMRKRGNAEASDAVQNAPQNHVGFFARIPDPDALRLAIDVLWPLPETIEPRRTGVLTALGSRGTWSAVKHWRAGRATVPDWVKETLARKAKEKAARLLDLAALLENKSFRD